MQINISVQFMFKLPLTGKHVAALITLSKHHYDAFCKDASSGFLSDWLRMTKIWGLDVPITATWNELDTCLKLLEMRRMAAASSLLSPEEADLCNDLDIAFHGALRLASSKYDDWQAVFGAEALVA